MPDNPKYSFEHEKYSCVWVPASDPLNCRFHLWKQVRGIKPHREHECDILLQVFVLL